MKKIKEYINNKPRLKKTIKVFGVLLFILSLGFNILIISVAACSNSSLEKAETHNEVVATTPLVSKGFLDFNNSSEESLTIFTSADFNKTETLLGAIDYLKQYDTNFNEYDTSFTTPYDISFAMDKVIVCNWSTLRTDFTGDYIYTHSFNSLFSNDYYYDTLRFNITYFSSYKYWEFRIYIEGGSTTNYTMFTYSQGMIKIPNVSYNNFTGKAIIMQNYSNRGNPLKYLLTYDSQSSNFYSDGYRDGYNTGYTNGFNEGNTSITSPFNLISNAFSSIASILNIQIIPNLSLGVLLFAPLVIIIIIAIFKIFRG